MDAIVSAIASLFAAAAALTPLAIIGLLIGLFYVLLWKMPQQLPSKQEVALIRDNHLHPLPEIVETLQRIEVSMERNFAIIIAKTEGKK